MPIDPSAGLVVPIIGDLINAGLQGAQNRRNRKFTREMYWRQREDALSDWNMQNVYDSPMEQMKRLKAAGLNPNLVYGQGAVGNSSSSVRGSSSSGGQGQASSIDASAPLMGYADLTMKNAQIDLMAQQKEVLSEEAMLKNIQQLRELTNIDKTKLGMNVTEFDLAMKQTLADINIESKKVGLDKLRADLQFTLDSNERAAAMNASNLNEAVQRILTMQQQRAKTQLEKDEIGERIKTAQLDRQLKEEDLKLKKEGIQPGDPIWWRRVTEYIQKMKKSDLKAADGIPSAKERAIQLKNGYKWNYQGGFWEKM